MRDLILDKRTGSREVAADSNLVKLPQKLVDANFIQDFDHSCKGQ